MRSDAGKTTITPMRQAAALLTRAARPDARHLGWAILWLILAAGLEGGTRGGKGWHGAERHQQRQHQLHQLTRATRSHWRSSPARTRR